MKLYLRTKIPITFIFLFFANSLVGQFYYDTIANSVGDSMEYYFYEKDLSYFDKIFSNEYFIDYIKQDSVNEMTVSYNKSFFENLDVVKAIGNKILEVVESGNYYSFLHYTYDIDFNYYLLFRLFSPEGINYHEYVLNFNQETDEYFISDVFIYLTGEYYSKTINRFYAPTYNDMAEGKAFGPGLRQALAFKQIEKLKTQGEIKKAQKIYKKKIGEEFKKGAFGLFNYIDLYGFEDLNKYEEYLIEIKEDQKSLSSFYLMSIDKHIAAQNYSEAINALDSLYQYTYDDLLELLKGHVYYAADNYNEAVNSYASVAENFPYLEDAYINLLSLYDELNEEEKCILLLQAFAKNVDLDYDAVEKIIPDYIPNISKSEAYKNWLTEAKKLELEHQKEKQ